MDTFYSPRQLRKRIAHGHRDAIYGREHEFRFRISDVDLSWVPHSAPVYDTLIKTDLELVVADVHRNTNFNSRLFPLKGFVLRPDRITKQVSEDEIITIEYNRDTKIIGSHIQLFLGKHEGYYLLVYTSPLPHGGRNVNWEYYTDKGEMWLVTPDAMDV